MTLTAPPAAPTDDEALARRVCHALNAIKPMGPLGSPLHVQVSNSVVTLRGVVATYLRKAQILQAVCSVPSVQLVQEELWV
jgi:osmotically-inducible protein OsmY